jgi:four helix bundle protein
MASHYRELIAWQKAMDLAAMVYQFSKLLPSEERFGLASQMQRAAVSVPANIAEGHERKSSKEYRRFLAIASASLAELETHLLLSVRAGHADDRAIESLLNLASEVGRILKGIDRAIAQRAR